MPVFVYEARENDRLIQGSRQAATARALAQELSEAGIVPLRISEERADPTAALDLTSLMRWQKVNISELIIFSHQMASLTRAGISVVDAVRTLGQSMQNEFFREILHSVGDDLEGGLDIASSMGRHPRVFSELYVSLVHVGENTGQLDNAFSRIAQYLELERETRRRIAAATRYPSFVMIAIGIAITILNIFVIPAFASVFEKYGADLPWQTQAIIAVSNAFVAYWPLMFGVLVAMGFGFVRYKSTEEGRIRWHRFKLSIPIVGSIFERIYLARFCHTFAMVNRAGVPLVQGLHITARAIGNAFMAMKVDGMRSGIERGDSITQTARAAGMFSPVVIQMMSVGEETGQIDELLEQAAQFYEEEVEYSLKGLTDALEPVLIVGIAGLVLIMALGVFLPLWDLNSVAR